MPNSAYGIGGYGSGGYGSIPATIQPIEYYQQLITSQYQGCTQFLAWLAVPLQLLEDIGSIIAAIPQAFDIDYAVGVQLDILGTKFGQSRTVGFQPSNGVSPVLDDDTYRLLLKARIGQNHWDGTIDGLQQVWQNLFPSGQIVIVDNQNMTANVILKGSFSSIVQDLITNGYIVPRPETVLYTYAFPTLPVLGADQNNALIAGADLGHAL